MEVYPCPNSDQFFLNPFVSVVCVHGKPNDESDDEFLRRPVVVLSSNFANNDGSIGRSLYHDPPIVYPYPAPAGYPSSFHDPRIFSRRERSWHAEKDLYADPLAQLRINPPDSVDEDYKVHVGMDEALGRSNSNPYAYPALPKQVRE